MVSKFQNPLNEVLTPGFRATIRPLVINVPGSFYTEFGSLEGAYWDYNKAKTEGKVRAVREPGDEDTYGPLSRACL